jgi:hypothetical protein
MKGKTLLFVLIIMILSACQSATPEVTQAVPTPNNTIELETPYPPPDQTPAFIPPYPLPGETQAVYSPYPGPGEEATPRITTWVESEGLLLTGLALTVTQTANLEITIVLDDGRVYQTTAPDSEAVQHVLERCGDLCRNTVFIQE